MLAVAHERVCLKSLRTGLGLVLITKSFMVRRDMVAASCRLRPTPEVCAEERRLRNVRAMTVKEGRKVVVDRVEVFFRMKPHTVFVIVKIGPVFRFNPNNNMI